MVPRLSDLSLLSPNATLSVLFHICLEPSVFSPGVNLIQPVSSLHEFVSFLQDSICVFMGPSMP